MKQKLHKCCKHVNQQQQILTKLTRLIAIGEKIMVDLSRLESEVAEVKTVAESAKTLIEGLATELRNMPATQAAINAMADKLDAESNALAEAVAANTPAVEPPAEG